MATIDLVTEAEYRAQAEQPNTASTPSALVTALITAASRAIARRYEREFITEVAGSTARTFRVDGGLVPLIPYDIRSTSSLVVKLHPEAASPQTLTLNTDYAVIQRTNGWRIRLGRSLNLCSSFADEFGFAQLEVTGGTSNWGVFANTAGVAEDVKRACILTVGTWLDRATAVYTFDGVDDAMQMRPDRFTGWPIPAAAHFLLKPWEPVKAY